MSWDKASLLYGRQWQPLRLVSLDLSWARALSIFSSE